MTSSTLALDSDRRVLNRPWIFEKSLALDAFISPRTASMSSCDVTTTQARPLQIVPRSSVIVWRLSIRWVSVPMNCPTSSTRKMSR